MSPSYKQIYARHYDVYKGKKNIGYIKYDADVRMGENYNPKLIKKLGKSDAGIGVLYVDAKYRKKGIGSKLIEMVERQARKDKKKRMVLEVLANNKRAQKLYEMHGFKLMKGETVKPIYMIGKHKYKTMVKELK